MRIGTRPGLREREGPRPWWRDAAIGTALGVGVLLRLALLRASELWGDEATTGIMGLAVLRGERPVYFYGQPFMGALDSYLSAPLYALFGTSAATLELLPVLISLAWLVLEIALTAEAFGLAAARFAAILLALPPDYLLHWAHEGRPHYGLLLPLGTLALWLALRVPAARFYRALAGYALLGLVLGVAFWTNFLGVVLGPPVATLVWLRTRGSGFRERVTRFLPALAAVPGFVLGSLPHWSYGLRYGTAVPFIGAEEGLTDLGSHAVGFITRAWPELVGVPRTFFGTRLAVFLGVLLALGYLAAMVVAVQQCEASGDPARSLAIALAVLVVTNLALGLGTAYGYALEHDARYLLPLYVALPALLARGLTGLPGRYRVGALIGIVLVQAAGAVSGELRALVPPGSGLISETAAHWQATIAQLEHTGVRRVYGGGMGLRVLTFLSAERVIVSDSYEEISPYYARAVDGAERVGWGLGGRSPDFEANLSAVGVRFAFREMGAAGGTYTDFVLSRPEGARELAPDRFRVTANRQPEAAARMIDRDGATLWSTGATQEGGEWIVADLGTVERITLVRWLPGWYQEMPVGLRVETSVDGRNWTAQLDVPAYWGPLYWSASHPMGRVRAGRVELRWPPTPARFVRITQTGRTPRFPWTIRELFVYVATEMPQGPIDGDGARLAGVLRAAGVRRLYADHGWSSRVALADPAIRVTPSNRFLDAYGRTGAAHEFLPYVHWEPGSAVLLEPLDAEGFERMAAGSGLGYTRHDVGGLVLFLHAVPPPQTDSRLSPGPLRVDASVRADAAAYAADGLPGTRWTTGRPQAPGDWLRVDLAEPRRLRAIRLWTADPLDWPRGLAVEASPDGRAWRALAVTVSTEGALRWGGIALVRDGIAAMRLEFPPVLARALRLILTTGEATFPWTVHELTLVDVESGSGTGEPGKGGDR